MGRQNFHSTLVVASAMMIMYTMIMVVNKDSVAVPDNFMGPERNVLLRAIQMCHYEVWRRVNVNDGNGTVRLREAAETDKINAQRCFLPSVQDLLVSADMPLLARDFVQSATRRERRDASLLCEKYSSPERQSRLNGIFRSVSNMMLQMVLRRTAIQKQSDISTGGKTVTMHFVAEKDRHFDSRNPLPPDDPLQKSRSAAEQAALGQRLEKMLRANTKATHGVDR